MQTAKYLEKHDLLSKAQFGFRERKTVFQAQTIMDQVIEHARYNDQELWFILFDIRKAFPSVVWTLLQQRLTNLGLTAAANYMAAAYNNSRFDVWTEFGWTENIEYRAGVLEGLPSSPIFFCVYLNPLIEWLESMNVGFEMQYDAQNRIKITANVFADDGVGYARNREEAQSIVDAVAKFGFYNNYNCKPAKTESTCNNNQQGNLTINANYVHEADRRNVNDENRCVITHKGSDDISRSLGIFRAMNSKLRSTHHQQAIRPRIIHALYNLKRFPARPWFLFRAANAVVTSQLTFAAGL
jgi:hypothetical protein